MGKYTKALKATRLKQRQDDPFLAISSSRIKAMREAFGEYIVARQAEENLHKTFQVYKDDYVLSLLEDKRHCDAIRVVIGTHASDLKLFNIGGQYV